LEERTSFEEEVAALEQDILGVGAMVENAMDVAVASLLQVDGDLAAAAIEMDVEVDRREVEIEKRCLRLLETHRPRGEDLRFVAGVMKINAKLERMADLAVNIAEEAKGLAVHRAAPPTVDLRPLSDLSQRMVREGLDALVTRDPDLAKRVCDMDDEADRLYEDLLQEAVGRMKEDPTQIDSVTSVIGALRNLERIADQATNVSEDVVYMVDGEIIRHRDSGSGRGSSV
jgi:phosphate transport system protein